MRWPAAVALVTLAALAGGAPVLAQGAGGPPGWELSAALYGYLVPGEDNFLLPLVTADRGALHLEARHNYEAQGAGSAWVGRTFGGGGTVEWEVTPMLGVVLGDLEGVAPGYRGFVAWRSLELYSEGEYVFDKAGAAGNYLYNWSELTVAPAGWLRVGVVTQRTRAWESDRDVQRGLLAGVSLSAVDLTAYVLNPDDDATVILSAALSF